MKKRLKIISALLLPVFLTAGFCMISPRPSVWFLKKTLNKKAFKRPKDYQSFKDNVKIIRDINYGSLYPNGFLDIIMPKNGSGGKSLILWLHGGAYIAGDKKDVEHYMVMLAGSGFDIVNINYALAPESRYPVQLKQIEEAYEFISANAGKYSINPDKIFLGGDSAGAQLAAQYANIVTNRQYRNALNASLKDKTFHTPVPEKSLKGLILLCGPYDFEELLEPEKNTMLLPFKKIGWAYFGFTDKNKYKDYLLTNIADNICENCPPVFITDGNTLSFENQAKKLAKKLDEKSVKTDGVFYDRSEAVLFHQYQFNMTDKYALKTFAELLVFLETFSRDEL